MAQQGTNFLEQLKKIVLERAPQIEKESVNVETSQPMGASTPVPFVDLAPPLVVEKKSKRKECLRKNSCPHHLPKDLVMQIR